MIQANQTILFQGDSITEVCRQPDSDANSTDNMGMGYVNHIAASLLSSRPVDNLKFYNRGVGGNRITVLLGRWHADALALKPDWISILIGVNDRVFSRNIYEKTYRLLLETTREELPSVRFVLCEPFALTGDRIKPMNSGKVSQMAVDEIRRRSPIVEGLAKEFDAVFVPFQGLFDDLLKEASVEYWLPDGVHPSPGGHLRMAEFWKNSVGI